MCFDTFLIDTKEALLDMFSYAKETSGPFVLDVETDSAQEKLAKLFGIGLSFKDKEAFYIPIRNNKKELLWDEATLSKLANELHALAQERGLITHNGSYDTLVLEYNFGLDFSLLIHTDTILLKHTVAEERPFGLKEVSVQYLGDWADKAQDALKANIKVNGGSTTKDNMEMWKADTDVLADYCAWDCCLTRELYNKFLPMLKKEGLEKFFYEDEVMPLYKEVTIDMKRQGFHINVEHFKQLQKEIAVDIKKLEDEILQSIKDDVSKFEQNLLKKDYPISRKGSFPKVLADLLGVVLPTNKDGNVTLSKKELERASKEANDDNSIMFFDWMAGSEAISDGLLKKAQLKRFQQDNDRSSVFNLGSNDHLAWLLFEHLENEPKEKTETGKAKCDEDTLETFKDDYVWVNKLLELKKLKKLSSTYIDGVLDKKVDRVMYASFLQHGTTSGRYSCIAEGQMISMPGGDKPIEKVKVGDYVYCYTEEGKPTISKVTKTFNNGQQDCIRIEWKSQGSRKIGSLVCTPDHLIKTRDNKWVRARDLKRNERVYHMRRALNPVNGRARIYAANYFMENEEQMIKQSIFKANSRQHAHHKNKDKLDNRVENIEILSPEEHTRQHAMEHVKQGRNKWEHLRKYKPKPKYGAESYGWIPLTRFQALRMLAAARGKLIHVPLDFNTFKKKCNIIGLDYKAVCDRYSKKGKYLNRKLLLEAVTKYDKVMDQRKYVGVSLYKFKDLCRKFGVEYNHTIIFKDFAEKRQVYDLEVEDHHNFIANEICVHNCTNVNLQNLPRVKEEDSGLSPLVLHYANAIKRGFIAPKGYKLVGGDYSQLEARAFAAASGDPTLQEVFNRNEDLYGAIAKKVWNLDCSANEVKKKYGERRQSAKIICLATVYGSSPYRIADLLKIDVKEAEKIIEGYLSSYPQLKNYMETCENSIVKLGYVKSKFGRIRHLPEAKILFDQYGWKLADIRWAKKNGLMDLRGRFKNYLNLAKNFPIQSTAATCANKAMIATARKFKEEKIPAHVIVMVHDELCCITEEKYADKVRDILRDCMENTTKLEVPLIAEPAIASTWDEAK